MDGCLWYFGGISSSLKAVFFGHANKNMYFFLAYYRMDNLYSCREERVNTVGNDILIQTFQF